MLHQFMKEISRSNVKFVTTGVSERVTWIDMSHQFMKKISHSNVKFVTTVVLKRANWINIWYQFMKEISHSNVKFVTSVVPKRVTWKSMSYQFMKKISNLNVTFVNTAAASDETPSCFSSLTTTTKISNLRALLVLQGGSDLIVWKSISQLFIFRKIDSR